MIKRLKAKIGTNKHVKEVVKGSSFTFLAKIVGTGLGLISSLIIARYYGADVVGIVAIINSVLAIFTIFGLMGTNVAILRLIPEYQEKYSDIAAKDVYKKVVAIVLLSSLLSSIILFIFSPMIASTIFHKDYLTYLLLLAAPFVMIRVLNTFNTDTLRSFRSVKLFAWTQVFPSVITLGLLLIVTKWFYDRYNPIYIIYATQALMAFILFVAIYKLFKRFNSHKKEWKRQIITTSEVTALAFPMFLTASINIVISQTDTVMLGMMTSEVQVGVYTITLKLALLTSFILSVVNTMSAPKFSQLFNSGKIDDLQEVAQKSAQLIFWSTFPLVLLYVFGGYYILKIFGETFTTGYYALILLAIGQLVNAAAGSVGFILNMTGEEKFLSKVLVFTLVINILLNYTLIPIYGINGAALATSVSMIFMNLIASFRVKSKFNFYILYIPFLYQMKGK